MLIQRGGVGGAEACPAMPVLIDDDSDDDVL